MARVSQFYGATGVPLRIDGDVEDPANAWQSQRVRVRAWLAAVPDAEWTGPTRCDSWDMTLLVRHMASASQFLGYTLHQAGDGVPTNLLQGFDSHDTVEAAAALLGDMTPGETREVLATMDAAVDVEIDCMREHGWSALAEAPPGNVPADLAVSHFLFDSWVHEYDLMLPRGEQPTLNALEAEVTVRYLVGLASVASGSATSLDLRLANPDLRIGLEVVGDTVHVMVGSAPTNGAVVEGSVSDFVDRATGRAAGPVRGDDRALAVIDGFGSLLAS
jgi:hypothetical protein